MQWLLENEYAMNDAGGIIISDDYNPMESMQVRKAESYRKIFMERIAPELLMLRVKSGITVPPTPPALPEYC